MNTITLKDASFRILGYIEEESNGERKLKDSGFRILGYYDPRTNTTKDASFRIVGYGDLLTMLLRK